MSSVPSRYSSISRVAAHAESQDFAKQSFFVTKELLTLFDRHNVEKVLSETANWIIIDSRFTAAKIMSQQQLEINTCLACSVLETSGKYFLQMPSESSETREQ